MLIGEKNRINEKPAQEIEPLVPIQLVDSKDFLVDRYHPVPLWSRKSALIKFNNSVKFGFLVAILLLLQQCKLYENPKNTKELAKEALAENFEIPEFWDSQPDSLEVIENWYKTFEDSLLNELVEEAIDTANLNIIFQLAVIDANQARSKLANSMRKVQIGYSVDYLGYSNSEGINDYGALAGGGISWEADLWGKIKAGILAADENLQANIFNYSYTRQSITASVANKYFEIGTLNRILDVGEDFLVLNLDIEKILKEREKIGIIDMKDVHLASAQINSIKNIIEKHENRLQLSTRELEVILGRYPGNKLKVDWMAGNLEPISEISNPMELINRRPDIKSNESIVRSRFYLTEQARLAKYPSLVLSADLGLSTVGDLVFGTGAGFFGPIFNGGALDSRIEIATSFQKQALVGYALTILNAFNEVEASMSSEKYLNEQEIYISASIEESKNAYELVVKQYEVGRVDLFEVVQIQMQWLLKELDLVNLKGDLYKQRVQLYLALGGDITKLK